MLIKTFMCQIFFGNIYDVFKICLNLIEVFLDLWNFISITIHIQYNCCCKKYLLFLACNNLLVVLKILEYLQLTCLWLLYFFISLKRFLLFLIMLSSDFFFFFFVYFIFYFLLFSPPYTLLDVLVYCNRRLRFF